MYEVYAIQVQDWPGINENNMTETLQPAFLVTPMLQECVAVCIGKCPSIDLI